MRCYPAQPDQEQNWSEAALMDGLTTPRTGVFICTCGGKISAGLDTEALRQETAQIPDVVYTACEAYPCSKDGQARLKRAIHDQHLERVLIAGCSPRLIEKLFRGAAQDAGLDASYLGIANIREQGSYAQSEDPAGLFERASDLVRMGVTKLSLTHPIKPHTGRIVKSALVVGSGLGALTIAHSLAESGLRVVLVEKKDRLGEPTMDLLERTRQLIDEKSKAVFSNPLIDTLLNAHILEVNGHPGDYEIRIQQGDAVTTYAVGTIVVANIAEAKPMGSDQWFDRSKVKTQAEFESELDQSEHEGLWLHDVVSIFCADPSQLNRCSRICCNVGIRQVIRTKRLNPDANVTVLFRDLYLGGIGEVYEAEFMEARKIGVTFFRYRQDHPPMIGDETVDILDTLTGIPVRIPYDRVVMTMPLVPNESTQSLASLLGLPTDEDGFLAEERVRLRPGRYAEPGVYVLGSAQQPADTAEALFQAYLISSRAARFLNQNSIRVDSTYAEIDPNLCTGCGNCARVCPTSAIHLEKRDGILSLSEVDDLNCTGCGNCVVVCPAKAITLPGWDNIEIPAQISAALETKSSSRQERPRVIVLACEWSAYASADIAGVRHFPYPADVRIIRMNCSARFDPYHILWAFLNGADGVYLGACPKGECHYGTGNLFARERVEALQSELARRSLDPRRLHLEFMSVDDGKKFAETLTDFVNTLETELVQGGQYVKTIGK